jgi:hypothetical protein
MTGTANGALVEVRGAALDLSYATIYANSVAETPPSVGASHIRAAGGSVDHVDLTGNRGPSGALLVSGLDEARYVNRFDDAPSAWSVGTATGDRSFDPKYVDVAGSDPGVWDLHLSSGSSLIDAGSAACTDADSSVCDVGAYAGPAWP